MTESVKKTLIISVCAFIGLPLALLVLFTLIDADNATRIEWAKAIGGFGTFAAAAAVVWGFRYTQKSVEIQNRSIKIQNRQLKSEMNQRNNELFYKASNELSSPNEHARIAALYHLSDLTQQDPKIVRKTLSVICGFVRTRSKEIMEDGDWVLNVVINEDINVAFHVMKRLTRLEDPEENRFGTFTGNLSGCAFAGLTLVNIDLGGWDFRNTWFVRCGIHDSNFAGCDLTNARFIEAHIVDTGFEYSDMTDTSFDNTMLDFSHYREGFPFHGVDDSDTLTEDLAAEIEKVRVDLQNQIRTSYDWNINAT